MVLVRKLQAALSAHQTITVQSGLWQASCVVLGRRQTADHLDQHICLQVLMLPSLLQSANDDVLLLLHTWAYVRCIEASNKMPYC